MADENKIEVEEITSELIKKQSVSKPYKPKSTKQICNVINKTDRRFAIDFNGCGIGFIDKTPNKTSQVEVSYIGEFGTKSFKIESYKFI